ncbi:hypothetical protein QNK06_16815 [Bacillus subtilis]|nr:MULTISPECIES: hypothetical protein [Bacillus subtilis group]MEC1878400.1 hypothetical protein [Bacillus subtilis]MEC1936605.1 hypothetical protein [Bacillus subtilis]WHY08555.1 hypothetical protein QNK06_16815 [Bacillus subtilis]
MKLEPIIINPNPISKEEKTEVEQLKEQILDLQRVCNVLMANQS